MYKEEMKTYLSLLPGLIKTEANKYIVIKNDRFMVCPNHGTAEKYGFRIYKEGYLVKRIRREDLNISGILLKANGFDDMKSLNIVKTICDRELPLTIRKLTEEGKLRLEEMQRMESIVEEENKVKEQNDKRRNIARAWRNLVGEAKYDMSEDVWQFINWERPDSFTNQTKLHNFVIVIPGYAEFHGIYTCHYEKGAIPGWRFGRWEFGEHGSHVFKNLEDLPLVLAMTKMNDKSKVQIEEISNGKLEFDIPVTKKKHDQPAVLIQA